MSRHMKIYIEREKLNNNDNNKKKKKRRRRRSSTLIYEWKIA
jgi:hypothetical protein